MSIEMLAYGTISFGVTAVLETGWLAFPEYGNKLPREFINLINIRITSSLIFGKIPFSSRIFFIENVEDFCLFEKRSYYATQIVFKLTILPPQLPKSWDVGMGPIPRLKGSFVIINTISVYYWYV